MYVVRVFTFGNFKKKISFNAKKFSDLCVYICVYVRIIQHGVH